MNRENFSPSARRRAFTLIELVVVLGILSLLLVVTVPRVGALYDRQLVEQQVRLLEKDLSACVLRHSAAAKKRLRSLRRRLSSDGARCERRTDTDKSAGQ